MRRGTAGEIAVSAHDEDGAQQTRSSRRSEALAQIVRSNPAIGLRLITFLNCIVGRSHDDKAS